ncbi:MAG: hypothetical protein J6P58_08430, partial [Oscillospiraceae bacterium]|nr:hypothetical protein [Oscillospiraceae bacterium]
MSTLTLCPNDDLQSALDRAPAGSTVHFRAGVYRQKIMLRTPGLTLEGEGADQSVLVFDDYARKPDELGREYNTFRTWTLAVCADDVHMYNLAVVNDALSPEAKGQEVALSVYGDRFVMEDCLLRSTQDTLFLGPLPEDLIARYNGFLPDELRRSGQLSQRFTRCRIEGTVDFIFGCGRTLFEDCEIRSLFEIRGVGYAAAPAHPLEEEQGFLFRRCAFTAEPSVPAVVEETIVVTPVAEAPAEEAPAVAVEEEAVVVEAPAPVAEVIET